MIEKLFENHLAKWSMYRLEKFSNIHHGETCYIFGDGPSLKWFDIKNFSNHPAICCNLLPFHNDFEKLDVKYCLMMEPWIFAPKIIQPNIRYVTEFREIAKLYLRKLKAYPEKQFFVHISNYFNLRGSNINYTYRFLPRIGNKTDKLLQLIKPFSGSFYGALTLAYFMGFSKAYLIGHDAWTIQPSRNRHWYEKGEGDLFEPKNFAFDLLDIISNKMQLFTITNDGDSCNVKAISYQTFCRKPPLYKENTQLLHRELLDVLATYPEYNIR